MEKNDFWKIKSRLETLFSEGTSEISDKPEIFKLELSSLVSKGYWNCKFYASKDKRKINIQKMTVKEVLDKIASIRVLHVCLAEHGSVDIFVNGERLTILDFDEFDSYGEKFIKDTIWYMINQYVSVTVA